MGRRKKCLGKSREQSDPAKNVDCNNELRNNTEDIMLSIPVSKLKEDNRRERSMSVFKFLVYAYAIYTVQQNKKGREARSFGEFLSWAS